MMQLSHPDADKMNPKIISPFLTWLVLCVHVSCAQQYLFTRYTPRDGLVNNRARFMFQDSKGRIYISTYGGLSVYDGSRFINYTSDNGLATSMINDIVEMGDDSLWIVPNGNAMHCMVHGIIKDVNLKSTDHFFPVINQLVKCGDGHFYALADQGLYHLEGNRLVRIPLSAGAGKDAGKEAGRFLVQAVEWNRKLFILTDPYISGYPGAAVLLVYDRDSGKLLAPAIPADAYFVTKSPEGDVILATRNGVRRVDTAALRQNNIVLGAMPFPYRATDTVLASYLYFDHSNNLWLATGNAIIKIDREGKTLNLNTSNGLPAGNNNSIFQDGENNMWFTNDQNGISKLARQEVEFYSEPRPGFVITDIYADGRSDSTWLYDAMHRMLMLDCKSGRKIFHGTGKPPPLGQIIIGKDAYLLNANVLYSLQFLPGRRFEARPIYQQQGDFETIMAGGYASGLMDAEGHLVVCSNKLGILLSGKLHQQPIGYRADQAAIDKYGRIWAITRSNQLFVFRKSVPDTGLQLLQVYSTGLPKAGPRSIAVDGYGRVWIGTRDHGLYCLFFDSLRLVSWKQLTTKNGLSENFVNYLECDPDNTVWACTPAGLDKIRIDHGRFGIENVTHSNALYQSVYKIMPTAEGIHWALVKGGLIRIGRSEDIQNSYRPQVLFSDVLAGNEPIADPQQRMALPYIRNSVSFSIGASSFIDETQTRYTYLLEGSSDNKWSTPSLQSAINFIDLPPGKYTLRVKAQFLTPRYPEQEGAYTFIILPPWWQTWWFRAVIILSFIGLGLLWARSYTRRKLEKQRIALERKQAIEKERTRIATDMHDDLGAGLSRIKFLSETIGIKKQQQLPIEEEITGIRQYSHEMIDKMGEIVWALNEKNDSLIDLLSYTRSYAVEYLMQAGIVCEAEAPEGLSSRHVSGEFRRNVYLTIKEALHNIVKHAQADRVFIGIQVDGKLTVTIEDDGIGFDKNHIRPFSNGLANMEKRVREIGGELLIMNGSGKRPGTTIRLTIPI
jgi:signal transduction histidine kinase/ligand-binding sensor domain-containing protein